MKQPDAREIAGWIDDFLKESVLRQEGGEVKTQLTLLAILNGIYQQLETIASILETKEALESPNGRFPRAFR